MNIDVWKDRLLRMSVTEIGKFPIFSKFNVMTPNVLVELPAT